MKNIILGGQGFIGSALGCALRLRGEHTESYDLESGFDLKEKDPRLLGTDSYVWFLAWDVGGATYITDQNAQLGILKNNIALCERIFSWLERSKTPFTFTGTQMAGYPNAYGLTKMLGEYWSAQLGGNIARLWNIYGPQRPGPKNHVLAHLITQAATGRSRLLTNGEERRQFIFVDDCVEALLRQREIGQRVADITSGEWVRVRDLAEIVRVEMGATLEFGKKAGYESLVEPTRLLSGWKPAIDLVEGVRRSIRGMRTHSWI